MIKRLTTAFALGLLVSACAGGPPPEPPAPPPLDPVGTYDFTVVAEGMEIAGTMVIRGSAEEGYTGSVDTDMGAASITDIAADGQILTFYIPDVDGTVELTFEGSEFHGWMSGGMGNAEFFGTKRAGG